MIRLPRIVLGGLLMLGLGNRLAVAQPTVLTLEQALASAEGVNLTCC